MKSASYCCFGKAVSNNFFQQVLLINIISTYANLFQHFVFACFLLIEDYGTCALRKEPVIGCNFIKTYFLNVLQINSINTLGTLKQLSESLSDKFYQYLERIS